MYLHILRMIQVSHLMSEQLIIIRVDDRRRPERTESGETGAIRAGTIRHAGETAHREVAFIARKLETSSNPTGLKTTFRTVRAQVPGRLEGRTCLGYSSRQLLRLLRMGLCCVLVSFLFQLSLLFYDERSPARLGGWRACFFLLGVFLVFFFFFFLFLIFFLVCHFEVYCSL